MKLRNKKTGEIKECAVIPIDSNGYPNEYQVFEKGNSLAELNEEWEDYEDEEEEFWYVDTDCETYGVSRAFNQNNSDDVLFNKSIGNYFGTREEAEEVIKKLKAWKRLKDKCFRFYRWNKGSLLKSLPNTIEFACDDTKMWTWEDIQDDLDLLFGGEDE